jgi:metal-sulfur cluster biosynthetic enzyme
MSGTPFPYDGPAEMAAPVVQALSRVIDPEFALTIVDLGLIYGVNVDADRVHVLLTMTSAACPVADVIIDDAGHELSQVAGDRAVDVELVWEPPWSPERLSERARRFMLG